jgi:hypothetical protein
MEIGFLDITINRENTKVNCNIYRKPTMTCTIIHNTSCHPKEHKAVAFNYSHNRINTYPLSQTNKNLKVNIINQIAHENGYNNKSTQIQRKVNTMTEDNDKKTNTQEKWATFTYVSKQTKYITKMFKDTNI